MLRARAGSLTLTRSPLATPPAPARPAPRSTPTVGATHIPISSRKESRAEAAAEPVRASTRKGERTVQGARDV
eukprot:3583784-Rhodomonas_salina.1